jgi:hypothetical protein
MVVKDYTPEAASQMIAEAQAAVTASAAAVPVTSKIQTQDRMDGEKFANAKKSLAAMFANRNPVVPVDKTKPAPSSMTL